MMLLKVRGQGDQAGEGMGKHFKGPWPHAPALLAVGQGQDPRLQVPHSTGTQGTSRAEETLLQARGRGAMGHWEEHPHH